jgi:hypothetical protein
MVHELSQCRTQEKRHRDSEEDGVLIIVCGRDEECAYGQHPRQGPEAALWLTGSPRPGGDYKPYRESDKPSSRSMSAKRWNASGPHWNIWALRSITPAISPPLTSPVGLDS